MKGLQTKDSRGEWPHEIRLEETAEDVALLLLYMYKHAAGCSLERELRGSYLDNAERLVKIAYRLDVQHLLTHLDSYLVTSDVFTDVLDECFSDRGSYGIEPEDAFRWLSLADQYHLPGFTEHCQVFLAENFKAVTEIHDGRLQELSSNFLTNVMERVAKALPS